MNRELEEKIQIWNEYKNSRKIKLTYEEYLYLIEKYNYLLTDTVSFVELTITQDLLNKNEIKDLIKNPQHINSVNFSFDKINNINFDKLELLYKYIKDNNPFFEEDINKLFYKEYDVPEESIDVLKQESIEFNKLLTKINNNMSELEKFLIIYNELGKKISYPQNWNYGYFRNSNEVLSNSNLQGIITNESICGGYTIILQQALELAGLNVKSRVGSMNGAFHAWNQVEIDGQWYNVDLTSDANNIKADMVPVFCLKSDDQFLNFGYIDNGSLIPNFENRSNCNTNFEMTDISPYFDKRLKAKNEDFIPTIDVDSELQMKNYMKTRIKSLTKIQIEDNKGYIGEGILVLKSKKELLEEKEKLIEKIEDLDLNNVIDTKEKNMLIDFIKEEYKNMILKAPDESFSISNRSNNQHEQMNNQPDNSEVQSNITTSQEEIIDDVPHEFKEIYDMIFNESVIREMREKYGYFEMSDEEKEFFDDKLENTMTRTRYEEMKKGEDSLADLRREAWKKIKHRLQSEPMIDLETLIRQEEFGEIENEQIEEVEKTGRRIY